MEKSHTELIQRAEELKKEILEVKNPKQMNFSAQAMRPQPQFERIQKNFLNGSLQVLRERPRCAHRFQLSRCQKI